MEADSCQFCSKDLSKLNVVNTNRHIQACSRKRKSTLQSKSIASFFPKKSKLSVSLDGLESRVGHSDADGKCQLKGCNTEYDER